MPAAKLARIGDHDAESREHAQARRGTPTPIRIRRSRLMDLPQSYIDMYGVRNVEFQHGHLAQDTTNPDPALFKELKAKLDAVGSRANQINIEIGVMAQMAGGRQGGRSGGRRACGVADDGQEMGRRRAAARDQTVDAQSGGAHRRFQGRRHLALEGTAGLRQAEGDHDLQRDAGNRRAQLARRRSRRRRRPPARARPRRPPCPRTERLRYVWGILNECVEKSGGYSNLDFGGAGRFKNQQQLHDAIKGLMKRNSGSMHIKSSPDWDIGKADRVRRVDRVPGPLHDRGEPGSGDSHRVQHDSREHRLAGC